VVRSLQKGFVGGRNRLAKQEIQRMRRFAGIEKVSVLFLLVFANSVLSYAQPDSIYRLPEGTRMTIKLDVDLSSKVASVNDTFLASVAKPVSIRDRVVVPIGTILEGRVLKVERAAPGSQNGELQVVFETLKIADQTRRIDGVPVLPVTVSSSKGFAFLSIVAGTVVGAALGTTSNSTSGVLLGAAVGAGAGSGVALLRKGKDAKIRRGEEFEIELKREVTLPVFDY